MTRTRTRRPTRRALAIAAEYGPWLAAGLFIPIVVLTVLADKRGGHFGESGEYFLSEDGWDGPVIQYTYRVVHRHTGVWGPTAFRTIYMLEVARLEDGLQSLRSGDQAPADTDQRRRAIRRLRDQGEDVPAALATNERVVETRAAPLGYVWNAATLLTGAAAALGILRWRRDRRRKPTTSCGTDPSAGQCDQRPRNQP